MLFLMSMCNPLYLHVRAGCGWFHLSLWTLTYQPSFGVDCLPVIKKLVSINTANLQFNPPPSHLHLSLSEQNVIPNPFTAIVLSHNTHTHTHLSLIDHIAHDWTTHICKNLCQWDVQHLVAHKLNHSSMTQAQISDSFFLNTNTKYIRQNTFFLTTNTKSNKLSYTEVEIPHNTKYILLDYQHKIQQIIFHKSRDPARQPYVAPFNICPKLITISQECHESSFTDGSNFLLTQPFSRPLDLHENLKLSSKIYN